MGDEVRYWEGYRLNPDGTIQFSAIVDYGILTVPTGAIFQFNHAASQAAMDEGHLESIQLHLSPIISANARTNCFGSPTSSASSSAVPAACRHGLQKVDG